MPFSLYFLENLTCTPQEIPLYLIHNNVAQIEISDTNTMTYNKQIIIYPILLLLFSLTACTGNKPLQARYEAEKMYHEAENALKDARAFNPKLSESQQNEIMASFNSLVEFCYSQLTQIDSAQHPVEYNEFNYITYQSTNRLSQIYYLSKQFDKCVK